MKLPGQHNALNFAEKKFSGEEVYVEIDKIANCKVIDMSGVTIYSGAHSEYGDCRLIVTAFADAILYYSE